MRLTYGLPSSVQYNLNLILPSSFGFGGGCFAASSMALSMIFSMVVPFIGLYQLWPLLIHCGGNVIFCFCLMMMVSVLPSYENASGFMVIVMVPIGCGRPCVGPVMLCSLAYFVSFGWDS